MKKSNIPSTKKPSTKPATKTSTKGPTKPSNKPASKPAQKTVESKPKENKQCSKKEETQTEIVQKAMNDNPYEAMGKQVEADFELPF